MGFVLQSQNASAKMRIHKPRKGLYNVISYKPLFHTLIDKGLTREQMRQRVGIGKTTLSKISTGKHVSLEVVEKIALSLGVPISAVVEVVPEESTAKEEEASGE